MFNLKVLISLTLYQVRLFKLQLTITQILVKVLKHKICLICLLLLTNKSTKDLFLIDHPLIFKTKKGIIFKRVFLICQV